MDAIMLKSYSVILVIFFQFYKYKKIQEEINIYNLFFSAFFSFCWSTNANDSVKKKYNTYNQ